MQRAVCRVWRRSRIGAPACADAGARNEREGRTRRAYDCKRQYRRRRWRGPEEWEEDECGCGGRDVFVAAWTEAVFVDA
jgi:hypothetical protein